MLLKKESILFLSIAFFAQFVNSAIPEATPALDVVKDKENVEEGGQTSFTCTLSYLGQRIDQCLINTPAGDVFLVQDGIVVDSETQILVPGFTAVDNGDSSKTCGIQIDAVFPEHFGKINI